MNPEAEAKVNQILAKNDPAITEADVAFLRARSSYLTEEQLERLAVLEDIEQPLKENPNALQEEKLEAMKRPQLDEVAENLGLVPADYANKGEIIEAILNFGKAETESPSTSPSPSEEIK